MWRAGISLSAALALLALAGCSTVEDTAAPPAPLPEFERAARLVKVWSDHTGNAFNERWIALQPAAVDGTLFTANVDGHVTAYDAKTGERRWRTDLDTWLSAGVGAGEDTVYVVSSEGTLFALDAADGSERWRRELEAEVLAPPAVATSTNTLFVRTTGGQVLALSTETGATRWRYSFEVPPLSLRGSSAPVPVTGGVLVGQDDGQIVALAGDTGEVLWKTTVAPPEGRSPIERMVDIDGDLAIGRGVLYAVSYQGRIAKIEPSRGRILWARELSSYAGLAVDGERVYVTDADSHVRALDPATGATLWVQKKLAHRRLTAPVPIPGTDYLAVADFAGYVHLLTRADGRIVAREYTGGFGILADPVPLGGGRFAVQTHGAKIIVFEVKPID